MIDSIENAGGSVADLKKARRVKAPAVDPEKLNRLPPHSIEAEQGVLGCLLLDPQMCVGEILNRFKGTPEFFYHLPHRTIYEHVVAMTDSREAVDMITLQQRLKDRGELESVGGLAYLVSLQDAVPSAANLTYYLDIVWEKYLLRRVLRACADVASKVYDVETEVDKFVDEVETEFLLLSEEKEASKAGALTIKDLVHEAIGKIEEMHGSKGGLTGIATGFPDLDRMTTGLQPGDMVVIAARPSVGKTSLAMNIAEHVAANLKTPVGVFSLEMSAQSLVLRLLCSHARVNLRDIREGFLTDRDFPKLTRSAGVLCQSPLFIDDTAGLSILQLRAKARRMHQQHGIKLFVIDYLQLLHSTSRRADNRQQEVADISNGIKALAKELKVPVIVLCQLNREPEKRESGAKPKLSDLRESGSIEQDADIVGLLYRDVKDAEEVMENDTFPVNLYIAKQRNGPVGEVQLLFHKGLTRFESASRVADEDIPGPTVE